MKTFTTNSEILVVDPDPVTLTAIAAALQLSGYKSHCARDSEAALKAAIGEQLNLIICNTNLEGESGLELCRKIQLMDGKKDMPVMFISSSQAPDVIHRAHEAGGAYYLRKPFDPQVLLELVGKVLWMPNLVEFSPKQPVESKTKIEMAHTV
ncbi:MAG: response regulator [Planctomycetota bacterium]|nr:response regulator [Planctomycetota bacterium]